MRRRTCGIGTIALLAAGLAGCATEPEPAWTEEEAYAAAEETFRGYIGITDPTDDEAAREFVTGDLAELYDEEATEGPADIETRGDAMVLSFDPTGFRTIGVDSATLSAFACIDDSNFEIRVDGRGWEAPRDDPIYGVSMEFSSVGDDMLIAEFDEANDDEC